MATYSTMAAFRAALYSAMDAHADLSGVQVSYGLPVDPRKELVRLGPAIEAEQEDYAIRQGRRKREEDYSVEVVVQVSSKATPASSEARAAALMGAVEDILADDPTVGSVDGLLWALVEGVEMDTTLGADGVPLTQVTGRIRVKARLV